MRHSTTELREGSLGPLRLLRFHTNTATTTTATMATSATRPPMMGAMEAREKALDAVARGEGEGDCKATRAALQAVGHVAPHVRQITPGCSTHVTDTLLGPDPEVPREYPTEH